MTDVTDTRNTILLTGFGPFPGVPQNASGDLVFALAEETRHTLPAYRVAPEILPTAWMPVPELIASLHVSHAPVLALHFGVAHGARGFQIETTARNTCRAARDAVGAMPASTKLACGGAEFRASTIEAGAVVETLNGKGFPASLSRDAGGYLCNAAFYHSLAAADAGGGRCRVGFVHIPTDLSKADFTMVEAISGALEIIKIALRGTDFGRS